MTDILVLDNVAKRFGRVSALSDVSVAVPSGMIYGLLGANGAGKTTLMRLIAGFLAPTRGRIVVAGRDFNADPLAARRRLGYMPENVPMYEDMRVREFLRFRGKLKGMGGRWLKRRLQDVTRRCAVEAVEDRLIRGLSRGYRQRVGLADALLNEPDLLVLDEPLSNLDPTQRRQMLALIQSFRGHHAVLMSSHILSEIESVCERVVILHKGRVLAQGATSELLPLEARRFRIEMEFLPRDGSVPVAIRLAETAGLPAEAVTLNPLAEGWYQFLCECRDADPVREAVLAWIADSGAALRELHVRAATLEDMYVALTQRVPGGIVE